jgi:hypothetical protein
MDDIGDSSCDGVNEALPICGRLCKCAHRIGEPPKALLKTLGGPTDIGR